MKYDQYANFPVILVSKPGTIVEDLDQKKHIQGYSYFETFDNKKVLIVHGNERGIFPKESREAITKFSPDIIYCCFPSSCRRATGDNRIKGNHDTPTQYKRTEVGENQVTFALYVH